MQTKVTILFLSLYFSVFHISCDKNHPPIIEQFICESDSVAIGDTVDFEIIISDADGDPIHCFWSFNGKLNAAYNHKTKIKWIAPLSPDTVNIKVEVDDGTNYTYLDKVIIVF